MISDLALGPESRCRATEARDAAGPERFRPARPDCTAPFPSPRTLTTDDCPAMIDGPVSREKAETELSTRRGILP